MTEKTKNSAEARLTVIIPTYNRSDLVRDCVQSLKAQTYEPFHIVVVDDGGSDDTNEMLGREYPEVQVVRRDENGQFAKAINTGIQAARTPWLFLLNNDVTLAPDCLERLMFTADASGAEIIGPLLLHAGSADRIYAAGDRIRRNGRPEPVGYRETSAGFDYHNPVFGITAGAALVHRSVFDHIGLFDTRFVAYFEDADFNFRARLAGFRPVLVPEAVGWHHGAASIDGKLWWRTRQCFRNHMLLVAKNMPVTLLFRHSIPIAWEILRGAGRTFSAVRCDRGAAAALGEVAGAGREALSLLPVVLSDRRRIQRNRVLSAREVNALLTR